MTTQTAIRVTNRAGLPDAIVRAIANDGYSLDTPYLSVLS